MQIWVNLSGRPSLRLGLQEELSIRRIRSPPHSTNNTMCFWHGDHDGLLHMHWAPSPWAQLEHCYTAVRCVDCLQDHQRLPYSPILRRDRSMLHSSLSHSRFVIWTPSPNRDIRRISGVKFGDQPLTHQKQSTSGISSLELDPPFASYRVIYPHL